MGVAPVGVAPVNDNVEPVSAAELRLKKYQNGPTWIKMDQNGSTWIKMDQHGSKWINIDQNGSIFNIQYESNRIKIDRYGKYLDKNRLKWIKMDRYGSKAIKMDYYGSK